MILLDIPDDVARARIAGRAREGRPDDAREATIERRLRRFRSETEPLIDLFRRRGILHVVDGTKPPEEVTAAVLDALGSAHAS